MSRSTTPPVHHRWYGFLRGALRGGFWVLILWAFATPFARAQYGDTKPPKKPQEAKEGRPIRKPSTERIPRQRDSEFLRNAQDGETDTRPVIKKYRARKSRAISRRIRRQTMGRTERRQMMREQNQIHRHSKQQEQSDIAKRIEAANQNLFIRNQVAQQVLDGRVKRGRQAASSEAMSRAVEGETPTRLEQLEQRFESSRAMNQKIPGRAIRDGRYRQGRARAASEVISQAAEGETPSRGAQLEQAFETSRKAARFAGPEGTQILDGKARREVMAGNSATMAADQAGNTMDRIAYQAMLESRSGYFRQYQGGNTLRRHLYREMLKDNSRKLAAFEGRVARPRRDKLPNVHPSAVGEHLRLAASSQADRAAARRRGERRLHRTRYAFVPVFLRKKEPKPKYDDIEKGLWYE